MAVLFSFFTIKEICDLKQENIVLRQMLALERQKDAALKLAVKDSIPQSSFLTSYTPEDEPLDPVETTLSQTSLLYAQVGTDARTGNLHG